MRAADKCNGQAEIQNALIASESKYRRLFETAKDGILMLDASTGSVTDANPFLVHMLGYSLEELLGKKLWDIGPFKNIWKSKLAFEELQSKEYIRHEDLPLETKAGTSVAVEFVSNLYVENGQKVIQCNIRDITLRKRAEQHLELLTAALKSAANAIILTDPAGSIIWTNPAFTAMTGYSAEEALGKNPRILKSGSHPRSFYKGMWELLRTGSVWRGEVVNRRKCGSLYTEEMTITPVVDDRRGITNFIAIKQDVTQQRTMEQQLRQSQKMQAIGQLAGGVAHDFNNILAVILGNSELLEEQVERTDPRREKIEEIHEAATHAASLTQQLLTFSRQTHAPAVVMDINAVVGSWERLLRRVIPERISINAVLAPDLGSVKADPLQIEQILMNLALNARDAMEQGGRLTIETHNVHVANDEDSANSIVPPGDYVVLAVSDTGIGMDEEIREHIFEPFFTTKEVGKGTGLGLATVYGIVKQSNGFIEVDSEPGHGSIFKIYLPKVEGLAEHEVVSKVRYLPKGFQTILLVEDSVPLLQLLHGFLQSEGYVVLSSPDPLEALRIAEHHEGAISLLITDVVMPGMSGPELVEKLTSMSPATRALYVSGYAADAPMQRGIVESGWRLLKKPFRRRDFISAVRNALDSSKAR